MMTIACPLCRSSAPHSRLDGPLSRTYLLCDRCKMIFVPAEDLPDRDTEKAWYQTHENGIQNNGYVRFLNQAISPTLPYLPKNARGLDYGCGPGPTLHILLNRAGFACDNYDPFFVPDKPDGPYDFIMSTECFEHFFDPPGEMENIGRLLKTGGILTIMTRFWEHKEEFPSWYYANDPTHVCFYHADTISWLAAHFGYQLLWTDHKRVIVLQKQ